MITRRRQPAHATGPRAAAAATLATLATLAFAGGCGLRTAVRPPEDTAPVIPGVVSVTREVRVAGKDSLAGGAGVTSENGVTVLRWKRAERSADGMRLDDLSAFVVERRRDGEAGWQRVATIDVIDQEKIRRRSGFSWRDTETGPGFEYRVIAVLADGQEGPPTAAASPEPETATPARR